MRSCIVFPVCLALGVAACSKSAPDRHYPLHGQVLRVGENHLQATVKHDEIKGFMPAMTMSYTVKDAKLFEGLEPGDVIDATLTVTENDAFLTEVKKVGHEPIAAPPPEAPPASSGFELLKPGEAVPDAPFVDQDGRKRSFASFRGSTLVLTFIYTRCPMPTFCPLMDRHFVAVQKKLKADPALKGHVQLVSVSFDPATDTPPVLKAHARSLDADLATWTFLTGDRDDIDRFGARFGLTVSRALDDQLDITHTLRTAIIDSAGRLVKVYAGNEWTPEQILADLQPASAHTDRVREAGF